MIIDRVAITGDDPPTLHCGHCGRPMRICQKEAIMSQKAITVVIDEFSEAVARVAEHAPPDVVDGLRRATGDLLEAFGSAATNMAAHEVVGLRRLIEALDKRTDRRHVDLDDVEDERRQVNE